MPRTFGTVVALLFRNKSENFWLSCPDDVQDRSLPNETLATNANPD